jgi:hypothetical protein
MRGLAEFTPQGRKDDDILMYVDGEHIAEAVTEFHACIVLLQSTDFVDACEAMEVNGEAAVQLLEHIAEEADASKTLPYAFLLGVIAARKALNPQN